MAIFDHKHGDSNYDCISLNIIKWRFWVPSVLCLFLFQYIIVHVLSFYIPSRVLCCFGDISIETEEMQNACLSFTTLGFEQAWIDIVPLGASGFVVSPERIPKFCRLLGYASASKDLSSPDYHGTFYWLYVYHNWMLL